MAAPPCTEFAVSGARWFQDEDRDGRTSRAVELIIRTYEIIQGCRPVWWALENPVGRINKLLPFMSQYGPRYFQPFWYGDFYSKKTGLWGDFNFPEPTNIVEPITVCPQGSWVQKLGGKSDRTKELRSTTPLGFAYAFFAANP